MTQQGLIHLYYGDGKGKTTAAAGLALRAAAAGFRVLILQFFKDGSSGEMRLLSEQPQVTVIPGGIGKFSWDMDEAEQALQTQKHNELLAIAAGRLAEGSCDLLILDEICSAWSTGFIDRERVLRLLDERPASVEVVLTGRDPAPELMERADYISEVVMKRHPYDSGRVAREGIEF